MAEARLDKWLWSARIFKTRSIAIDACKNGRVMIGDVKMKPSHMIKEGDIIQVRKPPVTTSAMRNGLKKPIEPTTENNSV